ncbi:GntR family transcriptional regulator [Agromyces endophyticus]|uniref:GntR family transcriptional regulator n=1 Tax=Agromyces sp. H17E-10 TaxID=2932244 RepID=UPI001FD57B17|nr:GntR family transcriptional regulator [Agromyces sp. H17E-10]UOQ90786.1 GntR family transcriptional regulator [Agromyces sp. H17E-10]
MLELDPASSLPPYEQLHAAVVDAVRSGRAAPGTKLPTVRALAEELGLAVNTVAKAYKALEADGVIEGRGRNGTFVAEHGDPAERALQAAAADYAALAKRLGVEASAARAIVGTALDAG